MTKPLSCPTRAAEEPGTPHQTPLTHLSLHCSSRGQLQLSCDTHCPHTISSAHRIAAHAFSGRNLFNQLAKCSPATQSFTVPGSVLILWGGEPADSLASHSADGSPNSGGTADRHFLLHLDSEPFHWPSLLPYYPLPYDSSFSLGSFPK